MMKSLSIKEGAVRRGSMGAKAFALAVLPVAIHSHAAQFEFDNGNSLAWDNYFTYGAQYRVQGPDHKLTRLGKQFSSVASGQAQVISPDGQSMTNTGDYEYFVSQIKATEDASLKLNTDDGNLNFREGLTQNKVTWISELDFKGSTADGTEYGAFLRGKAYYDDVYARRSTHMRASDYWRYNAGKYQSDAQGFYCLVGPCMGTFSGPIGYEGSADLGELPEATRDELGSKARFLDAFVYTNFQIDGQKLALRVGEQVINLGESNFYPGLMGMVNSLNAYDSHQPGVEVKELLLPTGAIDLKWSVNSDISLEGYYQYEWKPHYLDPAGSFFSMTDFLGAGGGPIAAIQHYADADLYSIGDTNIIQGDTVLMGFIPLNKKDNPSQSGQWGVGGHYMFEDGSDVGLYHVVYHAKIPSLVINKGELAGAVPVAADFNAVQDIYFPESYDIRYFDNIRTYGASFSTNVGEVNVFGEYTWTANAPVVTANDYGPHLRDAVANPDQNPDNALQLFNAPKRVPVNQVNLGILHVLGSNFLSDQINMIMETGIVQYQGISNREVKYDNHGWGVAGRIDNLFFSVMPGIDVSVPLSFRVGLDGTIREQDMIEDAKSVGIGVNVIYLGKLDVGLSYATYFGGGTDNWVNDRDNVSFTMKYSM